MKRRAWSKKRFGEHAPTLQLSRVRRLYLEQLEERAVLSTTGTGNPAPVFDTTAYPHSAVVQLVSHYDKNGNGAFDSGEIFFCSGAMIGDFHVLTAAHCVYQNSSHGGYGFADRVYVHAGRDSSYDRPFGEARSVDMLIPDNYSRNSASRLDYQDDIAVFTIDRNLGQYTGTFAYGTLGSNTTEKVVSFFPRGAHGIISSVLQTVHVSGADGRDISVLHYPAERTKADGSRFTGVEQFMSTGTTEPLTNDRVIYADLEDLWVTGGSSGSPVLKGAWNSSPDTIIGVTARADRVDPGGSGGYEITRINDTWLEFIDDFVAAHQTPPTDLPSLVDHDEWFDNAPTALVRHAGDTIRVSANVFNAGTAEATNIPVWFRLYKGSADDVDLESEDYQTLAVPRIDSLNPFEMKTASLPVKLPNLPPGEYHLVSVIDQSDEISEFGTPLNDRYLHRQSLGYSNYRVTPLTIKNSKPQFSTEMKSSFEVIQGESLDYDFNGADPEGFPVRWAMSFTSLPGAAKGLTVSASTGVMHWATTADTVPGTYRAEITLSDGLKESKQKISIRVRSGAPNLYGIHIEPEATPTDGSERITVTAISYDSGPTNLPLDRIEFYFDRNNNNRLDVDADGDVDLTKDDMLGFDSYSKDGYSWTGVISGVQAGTQAVFARAVRFAAGGALRSAPAAADITFIAPTLRPAVAIPDSNEESQITSSREKTSLRGSADGMYYVFTPFSHDMYGLRFYNYGEYESYEYKLRSADSRAQVRVRPNGETLAVWQDGPSNANVYATRYDKDNLLIGSRLNLGLLSSTLSSVQVDGDGNILLLSERFSGSANEIVGRRFDWDGTPQGDEFTLISKANLTSFRFLGASMSSSGPYSLLYEVWQYDHPTTPWSVRGQMFSSNGDPIGNEFIVADNSAYQWSFSMNAAGELVVAINHNVPILNSTELIARRFDANGTPKGAPFRLTTSLGDWSSPQISLSDSGWLAAVWSASGRDEGDRRGEYGVYMQLFDELNVPRGPETLVPTTTLGNQIYPDVVMDPQANVMVTWIHQPDPSKSDTRATWARTFHVNLPPQIPLLPQQTALVGTQIQFSVTANDVDKPVQRLTYSLVTPPAGATIDTSTGVVTWTPTAQQTNVESIRVRVVDNGTPAATSERLIPIHVVRPDVLLQSVTGSGSDRVTVTYDIRNGKASSFDIGFYRSTDGQYSADDTFLGKTIISAAEDLSVGTHSKTIELGPGVNQVPFPGAGAENVTGDYRILAAADVADVVAEDDAVPVNEDNLAVFSGSYHLPKGPVFVHGTNGSDGLRLRHGSVVVALNEEEWTFEEADVTEVHAWLGEDNDVLEGNDVTMKIVAYGGPGDDTMSGGLASDELMGGPGTDEFPESPGTDVIDSATDEFAPPTITPLDTTTETLPTVTWTDVTGGTSYELRLSDSRGIVLAQTTVTDPEWTVGTALLGGRHEVSVRALTAGLTATAWASMSFVVDEPPPGIPALHSPTSVTSASRPTFQWTEVDRAVAYTLVVSRADGTGVPLIRSGLQVGEYTLDVDLAETDYRVTVRSLNSEGDASADSESLPFTVDILRPTVPDLVSPQGSVEETSPWLVWGDEGSAVAYELQLDRTTVGNAKTGIVVVTGIRRGADVQTAYPVQSALEEGDYQFRVRGVNGAGESGEWSEYQAFTVDLRDLPPTAPRILSVPDSDATTQLDFRWTAAGPALSFEIRLEKLGTGAPQQVWQQADLHSFGYTMPHTFVAGNYQVSVRSENRLGVSVWSEPVEFTLTNAGQAGPIWQNPQRASDVNGDQIVAPIDALIVINAINRGQGGILPSRAERSAPFLDVNGDNNLSPLDALIVINEVNRLAGGEGELTLMSLVSRTDKDARQQERESFFAQFMEDDSELCLSSSLTVLRDIRLLVRV